MYDIPLSLLFTNIMLIYGIQKLTDRITITDLLLNEKVLTLHYVCLVAVIVNSL